MDPMDDLSSPSRGAVHESALAPPQVFDNSDWELLPQVPVDFDGGLVASAQAALLVEPSERTTTQCGVIATWLSKVSTTAQPSFVRLRRKHSPFRARDVSCSNAPSYASTWEMQWRRSPTMRCCET